MRTGWKLVPTKTRLEVMLSFFPPLDVLHSARLPLNGGSRVGHLARLLARDGSQAGAASSRSHVRFTPKSGQTAGVHPLGWTGMRLFNWPSAGRVPLQS